MEDLIRKRDNQRAKDAMRHEPKLMGAFLRVLDARGRLAPIKTSNPWPELDAAAGWALSSVLFRLAIGESLIRPDPVLQTHVLTARGHKEKAKFTGDLALFGSPLTAEQPIARPAVDQGQIVPWWRAWFDGAAEPTNPGPRGIGYVLKGPDDAVHEAEEAIGFGTSNEAEYEACIRAMEHLLSLGAQYAAVHGDSQLVINQLNEDWAVSSPPLRVLHARALSISRQFERIRFIWEPRGSNARADELSKRALGIFSQSGAEDPFGTLTRVGQACLPSPISAVAAGRALDAIGMRSDGMPSPQAIESGLARTYETAYGLKGDWHVRRVAALITEHMEKSLQKGTLCVE